MNTQVAEIALMFVLPLGVTFLTILQTAAAEYRYQKVTGSLFSLCVVAMDCLFYFSKGTFLSYNNDGGLLLAFCSLFFYALLCIVRSEDLRGKTANIFFAIFMFSGIVGISYWERPTLIIKTIIKDEVTRANEENQDYINSFANGQGGTWKTAPQQKQSATKKSAGTQASNTVAVQSGVVEEGAEGDSEEKQYLTGTAKERLIHYVDETNKVIKKMFAIINSIDNFELLAANISEVEREEYSRKALAISNNAMALNKKALGLFHPHESSDVHKTLIQATESLRLSAYSLYTYTLQENPDEQLAQYKQAREQVTQTKVYLENFHSGLTILNQNNQQQSTEN